MRPKNNLEGLRLKKTDENYQYREVKVCGKFRDALERNCYLKAFVYGLCISFLLFIPFIAVDQGLFLFYGDFNVQQVPFYQMCHDAIRSGNVKWSWTTDLGANFVGSYSFYLLGSPFFWLTIPFPSEAVPYLMGPLLMLKFACASFTGTVFIRRYVKDPSSAVLGGLLYGFSGFSVYNIFFNHFHEAIIVFPLLLWALDEYMEKTAPGRFCLYGVPFLLCKLLFLHRSGGFYPDLFLPAPFQRGLAAEPAGFPSAHMRSGSGAPAFLCIAFAHRPGGFCRIPGWIIPRRDGMLCCMDGTSGISIFWNASSSRRISLPGPTSPRKARPNGLLWAHGFPSSAWRALSAL